MLSFAVVNTMIKQLVEERVYFILYIQVAVYPKESLDAGTEGEVMAKCR